MPKSLEQLDLLLIRVPRKKTQESEAGARAELIAQDEKTFS
jgi:hypothetical protein